jgi:hypothetical protein
MQGGCENRELWEELEVGKNATKKPHRTSAYPSDLNPGCRIFLVLLMAVKSSTH